MDKFKFSIGDTVVFRIGLLTTLDLGTYPTPFMVVSRHCEECPGGTQRTYTVNDGAGAVRANEIELLPWDDDRVQNAVKHAASLRKARAESKKEQ